MTPNDPNPHGDPRDPGSERDAHLLAALRHAPDRDAAPPPAVSAAILARARASVQPPAGRTDVQPWWRSLASWALGPQGLAAFATLAVATLVGVIWSTQAPPEPAVPVAAPPVVATMPSSQQDTAAAAAAPAVDPGVLARGVTPRSVPDAAAADATPPPARAAAPAPARTEMAAKSVAGANEQGPVPAVPAAPNVVGETAAAAASQERRAVADAAGGQSRADVSPSAAARSSAGRPRQEADATSPAGERAAASDDPLLRPDRLLTSAPGNATWHASGTRWPHGQAQQRWWVQLREATRGRWQRDDRGAAPTAPWLELSMTSGEDFVFTIEGSTLALHTDTAQWAATLPEPTLRELRDAISRW